MVGHIGAPLFQDPAEYLAHNRGAAFLFQYTKEDGDTGVFSPARVAKLVAAAPEPKTFQWVKGGHEKNL